MKNEKLHIATGRIRQHPDMIVSFFARAKLNLEKL
jgi:hypothetical protein